MKYSTHSSLKHMRAINKYFFHRFLDTSRDNERIEVEKGESSKVGQLRRVIAHDSVLQKRWLALT